MEIEQIKVGFMDVFCYLVACSRTKEALFIDPAGDEENLADRLRKKGLDLNTLLTLTVTGITPAATRV